MLHERKPDACSMKRKKRPHLEYRLFVLPSFNEVTKKYSTVFRLETIKEFSNFSYEIAVEEMIVGSSIRWKIHGLRSPGISLPSTGPAAFTKKHNNLSGMYEFTLTKLDGAENTFTFHIHDGEVSLVKSPRQKFLEIHLSLKKRFVLGQSELSQP